MTSTLLSFYLSLALPAAPPNDIPPPNPEPPLVEPSPIPPPPLRVPPPPVSTPPEILTPDPLPKTPPVAPPVGIVDGKIPTVDEFFRDFRPTPGVHEVRVLHPFSKKPINLLFRLPEGNPKVDVGMRTVTFDYGKQEVTLIFRLFGKADVRYE